MSSGRSLEIFRFGIIGYNFWKFSFTLMCELQQDKYMLRGLNTSANAKLIKSLAVFNLKFVFIFKTKQFEGEITINLLDQHICFSRFKMYIIYANNFLSTCSRGSR